MGRPINFFKVAANSLSKAKLIDDDDDDDDDDGNNHNNNSCAASVPDRMIFIKCGMRSWIAARMNYCGW